MGRNLSRGKVGRRLKGLASTLEVLEWRFLCSFSVSLFLFNPDLVALVLR